MNHPYLHKYFILTVDISNTDIKYWKKNQRLIWKSIIYFAKETKTQLIAYEDRIDHYRGKYNGLKELNSKRCKRFLKKKDGSVALMRDRRWNEGKTFSIQPLTFENIKCNSTFEEIFKTDIHSNKFQLSSRQVEMIERYKQKNDEFHKSLLSYRTLEDCLEASSYSRLSEPKNSMDVDAWDAPVVRHLEELFNLPVYQYISLFINPDIHEGTDTLGANAVKYNIMHFGDYKKFITFEENYFNRDILLWIFEDRIVYKHID